MSYLCFNGDFFPNEQPVLPVSNPGNRYSDGLFETMRVHNGKILLSSYHFERLFAGMALLKIRQIFSDTELADKVRELCRLNDCPSARVRLTVSRGNDEPEYTIECHSLDQQTYQWRENGLTIGIYEAARKSCDAFANLKSANRLPYVMAGIYASENSLDDCLVLNTQGSIADSTIANLFLIRDDMIITPSLDQGCVAGVMRRYLMERLQGTRLRPFVKAHGSGGQARYKVQEAVCKISDLESAEEVFLTNAIRGIQWVRSYKNSIYTQERTKEIFSQFIENIQPVSLQSGD